MFYNIGPSSLLAILATLELIRFGLLVNNEDIYYEEQ
jgi:hypothetical protein